MWSFTVSFDLFTGPWRTQTQASVYLVHLLYKFLAVQSRAYESIGNGREKWVISIIWLLDKSKHLHLMSQWWPSNFLACLSIFAQYLSTLSESVATEDHNQLHSERGKTIHLPRSLSSKYRKGGARGCGRSMGRSLKRLMGAKRSIRNNMISAAAYYATTCRIYRLIDCSSSG
jgi:hypothetical protein